MKSTEISSATTAAAARMLSGKSPVYMVNLVRYRAQAIYSTTDQYAPCSGREAFLQRYVPAVAKISSKVAPGAAKMAFYGAVHAALVAPPDEIWDHIAIAEYSSFDAMRNIIESAEYKTDAEPHRLAALEDWRFIATTKVDLPS
jgi:hypothetical protein